MCLLCFNSNAENIFFLEFGSFDYFLFFLFGGWGDGIIKDGLWMK